MNLRALFSLGLCLSLSGCVLGSGPCLWLQVRHDFTGRVHFREFPQKDGVDTVPILILDKTQYIYSPALSFHCLPANDVQLGGLAELPDRVGENTHVIVDGKILQGVAQGQYTRFVIQVNSIVPLDRPH